MVDKATIEKAEEKKTQTIPEAIEEMKRHRLEDNKFWKELAKMDDAEARRRMTSSYARCLSDRAWLLRLMGHLEPEQE